MSASVQHSFLKPLHTLDMCASPPSAPPSRAPERGSRMKKGVYLVRVRVRIRVRVRVRARVGAGVGVGVAG